MTRSTRAVTLPAIITALLLLAQIALPLVSPAEAALPTTYKQDGPLGGATSDSPLNDAFAYLVPGDITLAQGQTVTMDLMINAGAHTAIAQQSYFTFTSSVLQVVSPSGGCGSPVTTVQGDTSTLELVLQNQVDNTAGRVAYASGTFNAGGAGTFRGAQITFCAQNSGTATLTWEFTAPRGSGITDENSNRIENPALYYDYTVMVPFPPTSTPTVTETPLPANTPTSTRTSTASPSSTASSTSTRTATPTGTSTGTTTQTSTSTPNVTRTTTATITVTQTASSTSTGTVTPTSTATATRTNTATLTPSSTATSTATQTSTATSTGTAASTETSTPTGTVTVPVTATPTNTGTASASASPTGTGTATVTPTATATTCAVEFADVPPGSTFYPYIKCLACRGVLTGYSDGTLRPGNNITRGQIAKVVSNAAAFNDDIPADRQTYADVPGSNVFWLFVERLSLHNVMSGYDCGAPGEPCDAQHRGYFRWTNNATRGQLAKIVSNAAGFDDTPADQTFEDVYPTHPFYAWIERLASRGIISGYQCGGPGEPCLRGKPYFRPYNSVTRGQAAKIVSNAFFPECTP